MTTKPVRKPKDFKNMPHKELLAYYYMITNNTERLNKSNVDFDKNPPKIITS